MLLVLDKSFSLMEQYVFAFSLIIEGTTEKALQFIMPHETIFSQNHGFTEQKMYFEHYIEVRTIKKSTN
jgi:hypothetical protein